MNAPDPMNTPGHPPPAGPVDVGDDVIFDGERYTVLGIDPDGYEGHEGRGLELLPDRGLVVDESAVERPGDVPTIVSVEIVVAVQSRALEEAPEQTFRMARVEAEERAIDADASLPEDDPEIVGTYHELGEALERERHPAEYLDALRAQGHDLMDLSFLVYRARP